MWGPFLGSLILHILVAVIMVVASAAGHLKSKPLPQATVVKLIRPKAMSAPAGIQGKQGVPKTKPALDLPDKKSPDKKSTEPIKPQPKTDNVPRSTTSSGELKGEAGTLRVSGGGFDYDFYLAVVQSKIEQNFRPPPGVRGNILTTVGFTIQKNGTVANIALAKPSGNLLIDQAAERAVRAAGRFPPLPPQYSQGQLDIYFEFVVNPAAGR